MTEEEYNRKREAYSISDAPLEVKDKAIAELDAKYKETKAAKIALKDFEDAKADTSDIRVR